MGNRFASGKKAIAICDRCGQRFKLKDLKEEIIKTKRYNLLVCKECWDPDHPQLQLGMFPVDDPQRYEILETTPRTLRQVLILADFHQVSLGTSSGAGTRSAARMLQCRTHRITWSQRRMLVQSQSA